MRLQIKHWYPRSIKTFSSSTPKTSNYFFSIEALFIITKDGMEPKYPRLGGNFNNSRYIYIPPIEPLSILIQKSSQNNLYNVLYLLF